MSDTSKQRPTKQKAKWDEIQANAASSLDAILKAPDASTAMAKYESLAKTIFEEGIKNAEATADAIIDKMNKERVEKGKKPLTTKAQDRMFNVTVKSVLEESLPDILGTIKDTLKELGQEEPDRSAFDRVRNLVSASDDDTKSEDWAKKLYEGFFAEDKNTTKPKTSVVSKLLTDSKTDDPNVLTPPAPEQTPIKQQSTAKWLDKLKNFFKSDEVEEVDEDKKAKSWLRQFSSSFGPEIKELKKGSHRESRWVKWAKLAGVLLPFAPALIKTIGDGIMKYCNYDTITSYLKDTWSTVEAWGSDGVDFVIEKIKKLFGYTDTEKVGKNAVAPSITKAKSIAGSGISLTPEQRSQMQEASNDIINSTTNIETKTDESLGGKTQREALKLQAAKDAQSIVNNSSNVQLTNKGVSTTSAANSVTLNNPSSTTVNAAAPATMNVSPDLEPTPKSVDTPTAPPRMPARVGGNNVASLDTFGTQPGSDLFMLFNARLIGN